MGLTASVGGSCSGDELKFELWFRRQTAGVTFTLQASSLSVKRAWLAEISCLLWRQAIQSRERRRSETALHCTRRHDDTLPGRPCMSADSRLHCTRSHCNVLPGRHDTMSPDSHIHDRFVAISIAASNAGM